MKTPLRNPVLPPVDYTQKKQKPTFESLDPVTCMVCQKQAEGYYSRHEGGGTCSKTCQREQDKKPKYPPPYDEKTFLKKFNL